MNGQQHDENVGIFGIGGIFAILGAMFEASALLIIGLVIAGIGLFRVIWYS